MSEADSALDQEPTRYVLSLRRVGSYAFQWKLYSSHKEGTAEEVAMQFLKEAMKVREEIYSEVIVIQGGGSIKDIIDRRNTHLHEKGIYLPQEHDGTISYK